MGCYPIFRECRRAFSATAGLHRTETTAPARAVGIRRRIPQQSRKPVKYDQTLPDVPFHPPPRFLTDGGFAEEAETSSEKSVLFGTQQLQIPPNTSRQRKKPVNSLSLFQKHTKNCQPMQLYYRVPLTVTCARGQYVYDAEQQRYLDFFGSGGEIIAGHNHPMIKSAIEKQMQWVSHVPHFYLCPIREQLSKKLRRSFGEMKGTLSSITFVNSSVEAIEMACLFARAVTGHETILSQRGAFWGFSQLVSLLSTDERLEVLYFVQTNTATALAPLKYPVSQSPGIVHIAVPDPFSSKYTIHEKDDYVGRSGRSNNAETEVAIADAISQIRAATPGVVAGVLLEGVQGQGGMNFLSREYLQNIASVTRLRGGLVIWVESDLAFGRSGGSFWDFQRMSIEPDILVISKGLAGGMPLAAVACSPQFARVATKRFLINTTAGNTLALAAGSALFDALERDKATENAAVTGAILKQGLYELGKEFRSYICQTRCSGLLAGIEFVKDSETNSPDIELTNRLHEALRQRGVLTGICGRYGNVLKLSPPLCVVEEDVRYFLGQLRQAIEQFENSERGLLTARLVDRKPVGGNQQIGLFGKKHLRPELQPPVQVEMNQSTEDDDEDDDQSDDYEDDHGSENEDSGQQYSTTGDIDGELDEDANFSVKGQIVDDGESFSDVFIEELRKPGRRRRAG